MFYIITFLEGIISFISPCMLPMLPIYISYFGGTGNSKKKTFVNALSFVAGFSLLFCLLGLFAGTLGSWLTQYKTAVNIICGAFIIVFGLSYLGIINLPFFKGMKADTKITGAFSAFLFGIIYSVSLTPCVGAFLGSALMMASSSASSLNGAILLLLYSLGLGIPFVVSALILDALKSTFDFIKRNYKIINLICGIFLIIVGIIMMSGFLDKLLALLS